MSLYEDGVCTNKGEDGPSIRTHPCYLVNAHHPASMFCVKQLHHDDIVINSRFSPTAQTSGVNAPQIEQLKPV